MLAVVLISTAGQRASPRFRQHMHAKHVSGLTMVDYSGGRGGEGGGKGVWMGGGKVMDGDKVVECWCAACQSSARQQCWRASERDAVQ